MKSGKLLHVKVREANDAICLIQNAKTPQNPLLVSIGISHNILLARMATRKAKPAGSYHLLLSEVPDHLAPLEIKAIHGVGHSIRDKIKEKLNVETLGELLPKSKQSLQHVLGEKTGDKIWKAVRGIDDTQLESDKPRKSVSAEVNVRLAVSLHQQLSIVF